MTVGTQGNPTGANQYTKSEEEGGNHNIIMVSSLEHHLRQLEEEDEKGINVVRSENTKKNKDGGERNQKTAAPTKHQQSYPERVLGKLGGE